MNYDDLVPLRAILHRAIARYLTVTPRGVLLADETAPVQRLVVRVLGYGGARTLYRKHRPACRSLDGHAAVTDSEKRCADCPDRDECTPQVRIDLIVRSRPYRLLLAFTSARNFLAYVGSLESRRINVDSIEHQIDVIPRGSWGELRFREAP